MVEAIKTSQDSKNTANKQWHTVTTQADFDTLIQRLGASKHFVIDTETTGFNKLYDRIIELAAVRADAYFNPVDS